MIDIPWTRWQPELWTGDDTEYKALGFETRRGEFRVVNGWVNAQYTMRAPAGDHFRPGTGLWLLNLPVYSSYVFKMDAKVLGHGSIGFDGSPITRLVRFHGYYGHAHEGPGNSASHALIIANEYLFFSSAVTNGANINAQLKYRAHINGYLGSGVEEDIDAQHPDLLEFGTRVDYDVPPYEGYVG